MELNRKHFHAIIFYNFPSGLTQQQRASMNLIQFVAMKPHQGTVFIHGIIYSTEVVVYSKTDFVKVLQNQLLFPKPLMLCGH